MTVKFGNEAAIEADIHAILAHRFDQGADYWATGDRKLIKGSPFSTLESVSYLLELGLEREHEILAAATTFIWQAWQSDGRFKIAPKGTIYPCQTAAVALVLAQLGYCDDPRLIQTAQHLRQIQEADGGWRCRKFSYGHGPETLASNPQPTLNILNFFRHFPEYQNEKALAAAIAFLLAHWETRLPIGPCHYGIGHRFMQVEYPFRNYNLFYYVYVLSFYPRARSDARFQAAFQALQAKTVDEMIVVERVAPKLAELNFCRKQHISLLATRRYHEIMTNIQLDCNSEKGVSGDENE